MELKDYVHPTNRMAASRDSSVSIELKDAHFSWEVSKGAEAKKSKKKKEEIGATDGPDFIPCLYDLKLSVKRGQLIGIAGEVGCGKTSLVSAIMGEVFMNTKISHSI